jgi:hypothetical protein
MKNHLCERHRTAFRCSRPLFAGSLAVTLLLVGCRTSTFDMRRLEQPVIANSNPFLGSSKSCGFNLVQVADYGAEVSQFHIAAGNSSQSQLANQAQVQAFQHIGGDTNRAIREVQVEIRYTAINALVALAESLSLQATGKVVELRPATGTNSVMAGGTSP